MGGRSYSESGVDIDSAASATGKLAKILAATAAFRDGAGEPLVENGYYASAIQLTETLALGVCTDGVGSKLLVAERMGKFDTVGIDCVAMNVNDLICIGAEPICMVDYVAVERLDDDVMEQVAHGLVEGARQASISIPGGETAQLPEMIRGAEPGRGLDLVGTAVGLLPLDRINCGRSVTPGDVVVGLRSSGLHSNGYTLARRALPDLAAKSDELGCTIGEALLEPTRIYVREAMAIWSSGIEVKAMLHITGDGLLNLLRTAAPVGWQLDALPEPHPIFRLIQQSGVDLAEMFRVFNMGVGFCVVVKEDDVSRVAELASAEGSEAHVIGRAVASPERTVELTQYGLRGAGTSFA